MVLFLRETRRHKETDRQQEGALIHGFVPQTPTTVSLGRMQARNYSIQDPQAGGREPIHHLPPPKRKVESGAKAGIKPRHSESGCKYLSHQAKHLATN